MRQHHGSRPHLESRPRQGYHTLSPALRINLEEHASQARAKYPHYEKPSDDDIVIDEEVARKIASTVRRGCGKYERSTGREVYSNTTFDASGTLFRDRREINAFLHAYVRNPCYQFEEVNRVAYNAVEVFKTLILQGEMDSIFRICAHPNIDYEKWWSMYKCYCCASNLGWDRIAATALQAYICLNTLFCHPEIWDEESGRTNERDYRLTRSYQMTVKYTTWRDVGSEIAYLPHRDFFGIPDGHFKASQTDLEGKMAYRDFINTGTERYYMPSAVERSEVLLMLRAKGLPAEIGLQILDLADYKAQRKLKVPHDPFHPHNEEELKKYLNYCWVLLVRCDMVAKALGNRIPWNTLVSKCIIDTWSSLGGDGRIWKYVPNAARDDYHDWYETLSHIERKEQSGEYVFL